MVRKILDYKDLSEGSKTKYSSMLTLLHKSGFTISEVRNFTPKELKNALGNKAVLKTNESYLRVIKQISMTAERKEKTIEKSLIVYENFGYRGKKLEKIKSELVKTSGNTFMAIAKDLQKKGYSEKQSYFKTRVLLKVPVSDYDDKLNDVDIEILERYDVES